MLSFVAGNEHCDDLWSITASYLFEKLWTGEQLVQLGSPRGKIMNYTCVLCVPAPSHP